MILWLARRLMTLRRRLGLARPHYVVVVMTIVVPGAVGYFPQYGLSSVSVLSFAGWSLLVVVAVAWMLKYDRSKTEREVDSKVEGISKSLTLLREEHERTTNNLEGRLALVDDLMVKGFRMLGVDIRPSRISIQAEAAFGPAELSVSVSKVPYSRLRNMVRLMGRCSSRLRRWVYG